MVEFSVGGGERATIQAVALRAGVSTTTVSLVLAGKGATRRISELTHRRVHRAAEELNYAPNLGTRSLRGERTHILSFFSSYRNRDRKDLYMNALSSAIEAAGGAEGYDILVHCNFEREPRQVYQFLNGGLADGLMLLAPTPDDPLLQLLRRSRLPVVFLNGADPEGQYSSVGDDVDAGMEFVADAIATRGGSHVAALIDDTPGVTDRLRRLTLLKQKLGERGIDLPEERTIPTHDALVHEALATLRQRSRLPLTVFCWHDRVAYALLDACEEQGIAVPDEVAIVGYDGLHWPSRSGHIVDSIKVDLDDLASTAVRLLDQTILNPGQPPAHHFRPVSFLRGTSLRRPDPAMMHTLR